MRIEPSLAPDPDSLEALIEGQSVLSVDAACYEVMDGSRSLLEQQLSANRPVYGSNTGYGALVDHPAGEDHGSDLVEHLLVGSGPPFIGKVVFAALALRIWTLSRGRSGVRRSVMDAYLEAAQLCSEGYFPAIPSIGSLGASGDLVPLAHLLNCVRGNGFWMRPQHGDRKTFSLIHPESMDRRESLACINGISFSKAQACLAFMRIQRLLRIHEMLTSAIYAALSFNPEHLHPALFATGSLADVAGRIRQGAETLRGRAGLPAAASFSETAQSGGPDPGGANSQLQAPYSIRCVPHILGACQQAYRSAHSLLMQDLQMVDDNPLCDPESGAVIHGGNFFGQSTAFASDQLNELACQSGILAERQLALLLDPEMNGGAGLMLASEPGEQSGLAGLQLNCTALVAEMRSLTHPHGTYSISTNGKNQDIVPMALMAARRAYENSTHLAAVLGSLYMALKRLWRIRFHGELPLWSGQEANSLEVDETSWNAPYLPPGSLGQQLAIIQQAFLSREGARNESLYN